MGRPPLRLSRECKGRFAIHGKTSSSGVAVIGLRDRRTLEGCDDLRVLEVMALDECCCSSTDVHVIGA